LLLTTHDVTELALCDQLYILREGRLAPYSYEGDPDKLAQEL
jgi:ABC-type multidrug transport system ATPase subunit